MLVQSLQHTLIIKQLLLLQNYYEELVSVRDSQIAKLQRDLDSLTKENEEHKKEMDRIVVELQEQM